MILEVAILHVKEDQTSQFEKDFKTASIHISSISGYGGHTLKKCMENKSQYILLVNWDSLQAHEHGFRKSKEYTEWKRLLHHYYSPFPVVEHYETIFNNHFDSIIDIS